MRQVDPDADPAVIATSSLEGYGAPIIDIMHWWVGGRADIGGRHHAQLRSRAYGARHRRDAAHEHRRRRHVDRRVRQRRDRLDPVVLRHGRQLPRHRGAHLRLQGRDHLRLVEEFGICQTIKIATKDSVEFVEREIPQEFFPEGGTLDRRPGTSCSTRASARTSPPRSSPAAPANQGDFDQGALVQETINAFEQSFRTRAWVRLPTRRRRPSMTRPRARGDWATDAAADPPILDAALAAVDGQGPVRRRPADRSAGAAARTSSGRRPGRAVGTNLGIGVRVLVDGLGVRLPARASTAAMRGPPALERWPPRASVAGQPQAGRLPPMPADQRSPRDPGADRPVHRRAPRPARAVG